MSDIELGFSLVGQKLWSLDLMGVFFWGEECEGDMRQIHLTVADVFETLFFWGAICLPNGGWKFISLTMAKADKISKKNKHK